VPSADERGTCATREKTVRDLFRTIVIRKDDEETIRIAVENLRGTSKEVRV
jgi:hypothetical protein